MGCCDGSEEADESKKNGEPVKYDPTFNGPIKNRSCTDVICCIIFIVFFVGFLAVGVWGFAMGDPRILLYPTDSEGNICGYGDYEDKPYVFFFDLLDCASAGVAVVAIGCPTPQICVQECPTSNWQWYTVYASELATGRDTTERGNMFCEYNTDAVTSSKVCVEGCPMTYWSRLKPYFNETEQRLDMICVDSVDPLYSNKSVQALVEDEECAAYYLESSPLVGRCVPTLITELIDSAGNIVANGTDMVDKFGNAVNGTLLEEGVQYLAYFLNAKEYGMKIFQDLRASWWLILIFLAIGAVITFLWIILMRWIAGPMVWLTIIIFLGLFGFATYYTYDKWRELEETKGYTDSQDVLFTTNLSYYTNLTETWLALFIICCVFLGIIILLVIFLRERICIAIALIKESSRAVGSMVFTLFWPLIPFVLQVLALAYYGTSALFLASIGGREFGLSNSTVVNTTVNGTFAEYKELVYDNTIGRIPCDPTENGTVGEVCSFIKFGGEYTLYLQIFQLFMWFWIMNFIVALGQIVLAGAFASYYWAWDKSTDIPAFPVTAALWRSLRYHLGSIAFGALIIAIIQIIRVMLEYVDHKLKGSENRVAKFFIKCLKCCFWCLEKFMKFINKNAYILIAVYGKNFCTSAKNAFMLIMRNIIRVAVVDKVTDFVVFIGKLMVVAAVGLLSFVFFSGDLADAVPWDTISDYIEGYVPNLNFYLIPVIIIAIATYVIASGFFSVYSMGVDTLFLCFLEDLERHDGSAEKPYYMSKELMNILGKKNKAPGDNGEKKKGCCGCC